MESWQAPQRVPFAATSAGVPSPLAPWGQRPRFLDIDHDEAEAQLMTTSLPGFKTCRGLLAMIMICSATGHVCAADAKVTEPARSPGLTRMVTTDPPQAPIRIGSAALLGEDWFGAYLMSDPDPRSEVIAELGRGALVRVLWESSNDHYYNVLVQDLPEEHQTGYVWKPFVAVVGFVSGTTKRDMAGGAAIIQGRGPTASPDRARSLSEGERNLSDGELPAGDDEEHAGAGAAAARGEEWRDSIDQHLDMLAESNNQVGSVLSRVSISLDLHLKAMRQVETEVGKLRLNSDAHSSALAAMENEMNRSARSNEMKMASFRQDVEQVLEDRLRTLETRLEQIERVRVPTIAAVPPPNRAPRMRRRVRDGHEAMIPITPPQAEIQMQVGFQKVSPKSTKPSSSRKTQEREKTGPTKSARPRPPTPSIPEAATVDSPVPAMIADERHLQEEEMFRKKQDQLTQQIVRQRQEIRDTLEKMKANGNGVGLEGTPGLKSHVWALIQEIKMRQVAR